MKKKEVKTNLFGGPQGPMFMVWDFQYDSFLTIKLTVVPLPTVPRLPFKFGLILECSNLNNSHLKTLEIHFRTISSQGPLYLHSCLLVPQH